MRRLVREAATGDYFAVELKIKLGIKASVWSLQQVIKRVDYLIYIKVDAHYLSPPHTRQLD